MNPEDFDERMNDPERREKDRREKAKPKGERTNVITPNLVDHATADGLGVLDVDLKHAFISKYGHLFCMDDAKEGSELFIYHAEIGMWSNEGVREAINAWVSTMSKDIIQGEYAALTAELQAATPEDRDRLTREHTHIGKLIQRWGRANTIASISTMVYNHLKTLHSSRRVVMNPNHLVLNCANGLLDLSTGELRWPKPTDYLTKSTGTVYIPDVDYKWWEVVVRQICDEQDDMYEFLHQWIGYSITGLRRDHGIMMMVGKGRNGKSLFIDAVAKSQGDYSYKLPRGFVDGKSNADNNEQYAMAGLNGVRFAHGSETSEGMDLKAGTIKAITGDDTIAARHSHKDLKTFEVTHKITVATNHKPGIPAEDDAMWARLFLFPTPARFGPPEDVENGDAKYEWDQTLLERCKTPEGRTAILAWAAKGTPKYLEKGLSIPKTVKQQVALHRKNMNVVGTFVQEMTQYINKPEVAALESLSGPGGTAEKRSTWASMRKDQRCEIGCALFWRMYERWCDVNGVKHNKSQLKFKQYLTSNVRIWLDDDGDELKMPAATIAPRTGPLPERYQWVRLTPAGQTLLAQVKGNAEHDRNANM
jgi:P4 family phage/plasmid primase-like protien